MTPSNGKDLQGGVYRTPKDLVLAINKIFPLSFDLACFEENKVLSLLPDYIEPNHLDFFTPEHNSLRQAWNQIDLEGFLWCNPPFNDLKTWSNKYKQESLLGAKVLFLALNATGAKWYQNLALGGDLIFLIGRPVFKYARLKDSKPNKKGIILHKKGEWNTDPAGFDCVLGVSRTAKEPRGVYFWDWKREKKPTLVYGLAS